MRQLARTAGEGNYNFLTQIGGPTPDEWGGDEQEADEEDTLDLSRKEPSDEARELPDELDLEIGDSVAVKPGVPDPDTGQDIGGWQGRITDINPGEEQGSVFVSIEWDSLTLKNTPAWVIEQCAKDGLDWAVMNLDIREVEPATPRDQPEDVVKARGQISQRYVAGEAE
jgi:hypothetical protein